MTGEAASSVINEQLPLQPRAIVGVQLKYISSGPRRLEKTCFSVELKAALNVPSLQVKCKTLPNGKITAASKHKAGSISRKSSTEEKERGRDKEREKEESNDKEEKKEEDTSEESRAEEQAFLVDLYKYMKDRDTPIERIPFLGFKQSE